QFSGGHPAEIVRRHEVSPFRAASHVGRRHVARPLPRRSDVPLSSAGFARATDSLGEASEGGRSPPPSTQVKWNTTILSSVISRTAWAGPSLPNPESLRPP